MPTTSPAPRQPQHITISRGLTLPIAGAPANKIEDAQPTPTVTVTASDYVGMKPTFVVSEGERVALGQRLFEDKKVPGVWHTAPGSGTVTAIRRGEKRAFIEVVITLDGRDDVADTARIEPTPTGQLASLSREEVVQRLVATGWWTALRTRPFSRVPSPQSVPHSLFVTATDTHPLAADPNAIIAANREDFLAGLECLVHLPEHRVYCCGTPTLPVADWSHPRGEVALFSGPHPAGLVGTHMHFLSPAGQKRTHWHLGYQDVIAIGRAMTTGEIDVTRFVSLAGPQVLRPRLLRTRLGASLATLTAGELKASPNRVVSGSLLAGRLAMSDRVPAAAWQTGLGRYHQQISVVAEMVSPELFGWVLPGLTKFSATHIIASTWLAKVFPQWRLAMNTARNGGERAIFPVQELEGVMPLDILPIFLFRALEIGDIEESEALGALELDEEDVALCTLVDAGKNDYGASLRRMLTTMAKEEEVPHHSG